MLVLTLKMIGLSTSSGKFRSARPTASRTSLVASSKFAPHSNSNVTTEMLSFDEELIFLRLLSEPKPSSSFRVIFCSMSVAFAPL